MRILCAAGRHKGSAEQLLRFIQAAQSKNTIKFAAHRSTGISSMDWNLDALLDFRRPHKLFLNDNSALEIYYQQVKHFAPDLIVSDLEPYTSHIATVLNVPVVQFSSSFLYEALFQKEQLGGVIRSRYARLFDPKTEPFKHLIDTATLNLIPSHLVDIEMPPPLLSGFELIRPYHLSGKRSIACQHNLVATFSSYDTSVIRGLKRYDDVVLFSRYTHENFPGLIIKNQNETAEYACNLMNSNIFLHQGRTSELADGFYNGQFSWILPDFTDRESVCNSLLTEVFKLGKIIYDLEREIMTPKELPSIQHNDHAKFLHERILDL